MKNLAMNQPAHCGQSHAHESAYLHLTGQARYTDDIPELNGTLHAAIVCSSQAHAKILAIDTSAALACAGVVAVLTAADIPGRNDCGPIIHDDPVLAHEEVHYYGQAIALVVANSHDLARKAARLVKIDYQVLPAILGVASAYAAQQSVVPPLHLHTHSEAEFAQQLAQAPRQLQGEYRVGGQEQFYLEGQIAYALPQEQQHMLVYSSTQHPSEMQQVVAHVLGWAAHQVQVQCRRMGGGFGGKESQSALWVALAALAAQRLQRPVKLRADRDDDMLISGKRHSCDYRYQVAYNEQGRILAYHLRMLFNAGYSADLSAPVATRALCHADNAYFIPAADFHAFCARTNTQSNTAFRGFGGPQGALITEVVLDKIARQLQLDPLEIRKRNFYQADLSLQRYQTPYGQPVKDNVLAELVGQLELSSEYAARRQQIQLYNASHSTRKRGIALTPVKFGIAFNVNHLNQAGALVHIYSDGSVLVNHGGTEMGQGLYTKIAQIVADALGVKLSQVRLSATDTQKIANTSATAASTGTDLNGKAAQIAAQTLRQRLSDFVAQRWEVSDIRFSNSVCQARHADGSQFTLGFAELVQQAYLARVQLWADGFYATPGLSWNGKTLQGQPFAYYAYGAAVSEVEIDLLTGEYELRRVDILHDVGDSINPALDLGQVEGGFIQGMGWLTTEELVWNKDGKLLTHAPSTYKIPAISDCPEDFRVHLFKNQNQFDTVHKAKAVGEPPLLLGFSVLLALHDALASIAPGMDFDLPAPATPEAVWRVASQLQNAAKLPDSAG